MENKRLLEVLIELCESGMKIIDISDILGIEPHNILRLLKENNYRLPRKFPRNQYNFDPYVFDEINEESAYWVGFLMADGCITDNNTLSISLQARDVYHLEKLKSFLQSEHIIRPILSGINPDTLKRYESYGFSIGSKILCDKLLTFGITPRKSFTAKVLRLENNKDFWRGLIDGNGCLYIDMKTLYPTISLAGSENICIQFKTFCNRFVAKKHGSCLKHGNIYQTSFSGYSAMKLLDILYYEPIVYLTRKYEKYLYMKCIVPNKYKYSTKHNKMPTKTYDILPAKKTHEIYLWKNLKE